MTEIKPKRSAVPALLTNEDTCWLPELEEALRQDLSMALTEGVDRATFLGDDGASNAAGRITGLQTLGGLTEKTLTQAKKVKPSNMIAAFLKLVDGNRASGLGDLRVVTSIGANTFWASTVLNVTSGPP